jgi:hypothetical protein
MIDLENPPIHRFPRTKTQLKDALRRAWHRVGVVEENASSPGEGLPYLVPWRFAKVRRLPNKLQLWLMIYDESVAFVCALHLCCELELARAAKPAHRGLVEAIYRLSARVTSDLYAVRSLVCYGLEPAARVVLRSAMEHLDTISLLLLEPARANEFLATTDPNSGNSFWHKNLSKEKLRRVIRAYFKEIDVDLASVHLSRRERRSTMYGIAVHPSAYSCDMSIFSPEAMEKRGVDHIGVGYPTVLSCNTLDDAVWSIFELGLVLKMRAVNPTGTLQGVFSSDADQYFFGIIAEGPSILLSILTTIGRPSLNSVYYDFLSSS